MVGQEDIWHTYIHTMEYYLTIRNDELIQSGQAGIEGHPEVSQERDRHRMI